MSEETFKILFEKSTDPMLILDGDTCADCNEAALNFLRCSRHQLIGLHLWDISPERQPDGCPSSEKAWEHMEKALTEGSDRFEWFCRPLGNQERWCDISLTRISILGKDFLHSTWRDKSAQKRAEDSLRTSQLQLSEVADLAKIAYWELDEAQNELVLNDAFYALFGTTSEEEGGYRMPPEKYFEKFVHPDDRERVRAEVQKNRVRLKRDGLVEHEHRALRGDGEVIHILTRTRIVKDAKGHTARVMGVNQDITERKRLEDGLLQAQKMEVFGTLAAGIAHDFGNILTAVTGFANRGVDLSGNDSKLRHCFSGILLASRRGRELIKQILSLSRRGEEARKPIDLIPVVKECVRMLDASLPAGVEMREKIGPGPSLVLADPTQIQQIIFNLATNAVHAMGRRGGKLTIELSHFTPTASDRVLYPALASTAYVRLSVGDTGVGMNEDVLARVFEPLFTTKKHGEGTGLGLWLVQGIVKNHEGFITVRSAPGKGSTFDVFLPCIIN